MHDGNFYGGCEMSKRGFAKRSLMALFAIVLAAVSQSSLADLTDASWTVRRVGSDVEIVNTNKASFRKYAFHRASGMLKCIGWNVRQPEKFYVNGESLFVLSCDGTALSHIHLTFPSPFVPLGGGNSGCEQILV